MRKHCTHTELTENGITTKTGNREALGRLRSNRTVTLILQSLWYIVTLMAPTHSQHGHVTSLANGMQQM